MWDEKESKGGFVPLFEVVFEGGGGPQLGNCWLDLLNVVGVPHLDDAGDSPTRDAEGHGGGRQDADVGTVEADGVAAPGGRKGGQVVLHCCLGPSPVGAFLLAVVVHVLQDVQLLGVPEVAEVDGAHVDNWLLPSSVPDGGDSVATLRWKGWVRENGKEEGWGSRGKGWDLT